MDLLRDLLNLPEGDKDNWPLIAAALATFIVAPSPSAIGQTQDDKMLKIAETFLARSQRREAALQSLIDAQQKCSVQRTASIFAGQLKRGSECLVLDELLGQTSLDTIVGHDMSDIEARLTPEDVWVLKSAIARAAYSGYEQGKRGKAGQ